MKLCARYNSFSKGKFSIFNVKKIVFLHYIELRKLKLHKEYFMNFRESFEAVIFVFKLALLIIGNSSLI